MAEELVEAALQRVVLLPEPEMPLPHQAGDVAGLAHHVAQRRLVLGQPELGVGVALVVRGRVVLVAEPVLVAAREDPGPHRTADRRRDVAVGQPDPVRRQLVDVRRRDDGRAVGADVAVAEVVGEDDDHVGRRGRFFSHVGGRSATRHGKGQREGRCERRCVGGPPMGLHVELLSSVCRVTPATCNSSSPRRSRRLRRRTSRPWDRRRVAV